MQTTITYKTSYKLPNNNTYKQEANNKQKGQRNKVSGRGDAGSGEGVT